MAILVFLSLNNSPFFMQVSTILVFFCKFFTIYGSWNKKLLRNFDLKITNFKKLWNQQISHWKLYANKRFCDGLVTSLIGGVMAGCVFAWFSALHTLITAIVGGGIIKWGRWKFREFFLNQAMRGGRLCLKWLILFTYVQKHFWKFSNIFFSFIYMSWKLQI